MGDKICLRTLNHWAAELLVNISRHLKLEIATAIPALNEKYLYLWKIDISQIALFD